MYDLEYLSDSSTSSTSTIKNNASNGAEKNYTELQGGDCDSDSTIIIDMDLDNITKKYSSKLESGGKCSDSDFNLKVDEDEPSIVSNGNLMQNGANPDETETTSSSKYTFSRGASFVKNKSSFASNRFTNSNSNHIFNHEVDPELESILRKYSNSAETNRSEISSLRPNATSTITSHAKDELIELSSDEEDLPRIQLRRVPSSSKKSNYSGGTNTNLDSEGLSDKYKMMLEDDNLGVPPPAVCSLNGVEKVRGLLEDDSDSYKSPKKKRKTSPDKEKKKLERAAQLAQKREEAQQAKKFKQALAAANKNMKPEECMKFITVLLDTEIANERYGGEVLNALQANELTYRLQSQLVPCTVTWNRTTEAHLMDEKDQLTLNSQTVETNEVLLIMNWNQAAELVHNRSLLSHIKSIQSILIDKKVSLAMYGLENYFKYQKTQKQRQVHSDVSQASQKPNNKYDKIYKGVPKIGKKQLELALTELQLLCCCCSRMIETPQDLGTMVTQFTKSIAQAPYKLEKYQKQQEADWYVAGDNKDCVRVDKNGNGLQRLWQQQLTTFPLARLEHAESIVAKYPTPFRLMEEYSGCVPGEGEKLLQDIPVRRAAGPLTTVKKIGPELSRKIYTFYSSQNGDVLL